MITPAWNITHALTRAWHRFTRLDQRVRDAATGLATLTAVTIGAQLVGGLVSAEPASAQTHHPAHAATATMNPSNPQHGGADRTRAGRANHPDPRGHRPEKPTARHTAAQTATAARHSSGNEPGYCLRWAHLQAGIPPKYLSATQAWQHASDKHRRDRTPPAGAAVYWTGGSEGFGHIAISVGHGKVRSTDAGGDGHVATVGVAWPHRNWGLRYAGWSDSINGYTIPGIGQHRSH